jgi:D-3-phosphoglycerate dehydrogenase
MAKSFIVGKIFKLKNRIILVGNAVVNNSTKHLLQKNFEITELSPDELKNHIKQNLDIFALWIHFDTFLSTDYTDLLKKIPYLITTTTGLTHIDQEIIKLYGDKLIRLQSDSSALSQVSSTAELAWLFIMLSNNHVYKALQSVKDGSWSRQTNVRDKQLSSLTLGIVGYGRLGKMVANFARSFNMKVLIYDIDTDKTNKATTDGLVCVTSVEEMLRKCDVLSLHASVLEGTKKIIREDNLSLINKPLVLINTARASLVDEDAILREIDNRPYLNYYTDVLDFEENGTSLSLSKLWTKSLASERILITPHIGGANKEAIDICENELLDRLIKLAKSATAE